MLPTRGKAVELGNGHFTTDNVNFRGRPVAKWIPLYGEAAKAEIDDIRTRAGRPARSGARAARGRHQPQSGGLSQSRDQRRLVRHRAHLLSRGRRQDARHRLGARPGGGGRERPRAPARRFPRPSTARAALPRPTTSRRSNWCSRVSPIGPRTAGRKCRAAWARRASSSTATSITCASSGGAGTS